MQIRSVLTGLLLAAAPLRADTVYKGQYNQFQSNDGIRVASPYVSLDWDADERTSLALRYTLDAVSAASFNYSKSKTHRDDPDRQQGLCKSCHMGVDAISGASRTDYLDIRHDINLGVKRKFEESDLSAGYIRSVENDYLSETFTLNYSQYLFSRNTTWDFGLRHSANIITPVWRLAYSEYMGLDGASLSLTQVLTPLTVFRSGMDYAFSRGFQSNPYAFIEVADDELTPTLERHPDDKSRWVASASLKQALPWDASFELDYRYYDDSWRVQAHTSELVLAQSWGDWLVEASWRRYQQTKAYFFENFYAAPQTFLSRDLKLAAFGTQDLSLSMRGPLGAGWDLLLRYSRMGREDSLDYSRYYGAGPTQADLWMLGFTYQ